MDIFPRLGMRINNYSQCLKLFWALCGDVSIRTQKLRKWSSFGHRFGHRSELFFTFEFLRCVHFVHDISFLVHNFWMFLEAFRADINLLDECLQIQTSSNMCIKVIVFCVTPIVPESFMIVSSTNVLVKLFLMVGGFGGRSHDNTTELRCADRNLGVAPFIAPSYVSGFQTPSSSKSIHLGSHQLDSWQSKGNPQMPPHQEIGT